MKVGVKVDLKTFGGTVPEGQYTVVRISRRVTIRDEAGNHRIADEDELQSFRRPGKIDWP